MSSWNIFSKEFWAEWFWTAQKYSPLITKLTFAALNHISLMMFFYSQYSMHKDIILRQKSPYLSIKCSIKNCMPGTKEGHLSPWGSLISLLYNFKAALIIFFCILNSSAQRCITVMGSSFDTRSDEAQRLILDSVNFFIQSIRLN